MMENSKRRRGISLSHHTHVPPSQQQTLDRSVYVEAQPTTRLQYPRYQLQSPSRHASAPKAKVHFAYPLHPTAVTALRAPIRHHEIPLLPETSYIPAPPGKYFIGAVPPVPSRISESTQEVRMSESLPLPQQERDEPKQIDFSKVSQTERSSPIPQKYSSYQQCKEAIGKRLFGAGTIVRRETVLQETDRSNRWMMQSKASRQEQKRKLFQQPEIRVMEPEIRVMEPIKQSNVSLTSIDECVRDFIKANQVAAKPPKKKQLNIDHEVFNFAAESKSTKENAPPPSSSSKTVSKKEGRKGRDPLKLQEMEKRLMEIIKICDDNLS